MTPSRRALESYDPSSLLTMADGLRSMGADAEALADRYVSAVSAVNGTSWQGRTAEAAQERAGADRNTIRVMADALGSAAEAMNQGYYAISAPLERAKAAIAGAEAQGFTVTDLLFVIRRGETSDSEVDAGVAGRWQEAILAAANDVATADASTQAVLAGGRADIAVMFDAIGNSVTSASERRFSDVMAWMYDEMMRNVGSDAVTTIRGLNEVADAHLAGRKWYEFWKDPNAGMQSQTAAYAAWFERVAPYRPWDHKPILQREFGDQAEGDYTGDYFFQQPGTNRQVYYDAWSNIHYGYVGRAAGFDTETLLEGQNFGPDFLTGRKDHADDVSTRLGAALYDRYGPDMTEAQFSAAVTEMVDQLADDKSSGVDVSQLEYRAP